MKSRREENKEATRAAIIATARKLFGRNGYSATEIVNIAADARVTTGGLDSPTVATGRRSPCFCAMRLQVHPVAEPMIRLLNSERHYGAVAIALHWLMALLLIGLVAMGLYMVSLPDAGYDAWKIRLILLHKELGMLALVVAAPRLLWRFANALPRLVETLPDWQKVLARLLPTSGCHPR